VISPSQRPLPAQYTTLTTDRHPCHRAGLEPTIPASERPPTHALDRASNLPFAEGTLTSWFMGSRPDLCGEVTALRVYRITSLAFRFEPRGQRELICIPLVKYDGCIRYGFKGQGTVSLELVHLNPNENLNPMFLMRAVCNFAPITEQPICIAVPSTFHDIVYLSGRATWPTVNRCIYDRHLFSYMCLLSESVIRLTVLYVHQ